MRRPYHLAVEHEPDPRDLAVLEDKLAAAAAPAEDATSELERLASLHDSGVLSDDEFTAAKAKILGI